MTDDVAAPVSKKRSPKRLSADALKERVKARAAKDGYRGADPDNVLWDTLRYDENKKKQIVDIKTVGADGAQDGDTRSVATSDLHLVRHSLDVSKALQKYRSNARRRKKDN